MACNKIGDEGAKAIAEAIQSGNCAGLTINLSYNNIGDEGAQAIEAFMQKNTTCIVLCDGSPKINLLNKRNTLIFKYPEFEGYIKAVCHKAGLYEPNVANYEPRSLKHLSGHFVFCNLQQIPKDGFEGVPQDLIELVAEITALENELVEISSRHNNEPTNFVMS